MSHETIKRPVSSENREFIRLENRLVDSLIFAFQINPKANDWVRFSCAMNKGELNNYQFIQQLVERRVMEWQRHEASRILDALISDMDQLSKENGND